MITRVSKLDFECEVCKKRADFSIERTDDDLPENYIQTGTRGGYYCKEHLPTEAKELWETQL